MNEATADAIKNRFGDPIAVFDDHECDSYCVGGAIIMAAQGKDTEFTDEHYRFPETAQVAHSLAKLNPDLRQDGDLHPKLFHICDAIIDANDDEEFDEAWGLVDRALEYDGEGQL